MKKALAFLLINTPFLARAIGYELDSYDIVYITHVYAPRYDRGYSGNDYKRRIALLKSTGQLKGRNHV